MKSLKPFVFQTEEVMFSFCKMQILHNESLDNILTLFCPASMKESAFVDIGKPKIPEDFTYKFKELKSEGEENE